MRNKGSGRFFVQVAANIIYSALVACLVEIFLITNVGMLAGYMERTGHEGALPLSFLRTGTGPVIFYVIIGIIVFAAAFFLLERKSLRYIGKIADAIKKIAEGDLNTEVEVVGDDELSMMAASLNRMEEEIRNLIAREHESERTKNELITSVAHDLRTPLTSVLGYLQLLSRGDIKDSETRQKYIDIAYSKSKRLEKLIEDLFGFTRLSYGRISMNVGKLDIVKLLGQLLEESFPAFAGNDLSYELISNVPAQVIDADANLLARLFDNLINNAIKYGAEGKKIIVRISSDGNTVTVSVTNYGYVIPEAELPLIFDKFYRVEHSRSSSTGGTGLGLAIAREIAELHGGSITAASGMDGTVFTVKLKVNFDMDRENFGSAG